jgi:hypothetical protein
VVAPHILTFLAEGLKAEAEDRGNKRIGEKQIISESSDVVPSATGYFSLLSSLYSALYVIFFLVMNIFF